MASPDGHDLIGKTVNKFYVEAYIGGGGMADVFQVINPGTGNSLALKVMRPAISASPEYWERFEQEAKIVTSLKHPYILGVYDYDFDETHQVAYIIMDYVPTGSLADKIRAGLLSLEVINTLLKALASALDYAHYKGVLHRDIKPDNVLIDETDNPLLSDFGLAKLTSSGSNLTEAGVIYGTPHYMSPEQALEEPLDVRSDIYSLGVMLFEMLAKRCPFDGESSIKIIDKHINSPVPSILSLRPDLPVEVDDVLQKAMAKDRNHRYDSAGELAAAFEAAIQGVEISNPARVVPAVPQPSIPSPFSPAPSRALTLTPGISGEDVGHADINRAIPTIPLPPVWSLRQRLGWATGFIAIIVAIFWLGYAVVTEASTVALMENIRDSIDSSNQEAVERQVAQLGQRCQSTVTAFAGELNDAGVAAIAQQEYTKARIGLHAAITLDDLLAQNCAAQFARIGYQRSIAWMNYAQLLAADTSLPAGERITESEVAYREALARDSTNTEAAYLLGLILIESNPTPDDLREIIEISRAAWTRLDNQSPSWCEGEHDISDVETFIEVRACFLLKTTEAHARYLLSGTEQAVEIRSLATGAIDLAETNDHFVNGPTPAYTAEPYYVYARLLEQTDAEPAVQCDILEQVILRHNREDEDHRGWATYASDRLGGLSCP